MGFVSCATCLCCCNERDCPSVPSVTVDRHAFSLGLAPPKPYKHNCVHVCMGFVSCATCLCCCNDGRGGLWVPCGLLLVLLGVSRYDFHTRPFSLPLHGPKPLQIPLCTDPRAVITTRGQSLCYYTAQNPCKFHSAQTRVRFGQFLFCICIDPITIPQGEPQQQPQHIPPGFPPPLFMWDSPRFPRFPSVSMRIRAYWTRRNTVGICAARTAVRPPQMAPKPSKKAGQIAPKPSKNPARSSPNPPKILARSPPNTPKKPARSPPNPPKKPARWPPSSGHLPARRGFVASKPHTPSNPARNNATNLVMLAPEIFSAWGGVRSLIGGPSFSACSATAVCKYSCEFQPRTPSNRIAKTPAHS